VIAELFVSVAVMVSGPVDPGVTWKKRGPFTLS
jgi:hypothetical protein